MSKVYMKMKRIIDPFVGPNHVIPRPNHRDVRPMPQVFIGPYEPEEAANVVEDVMNDKEIQDILRKLCLGEITDGSELSFQIQKTLEAAHERRYKSEPEGLDGDGHEEGGIGA